MQESLGRPVVIENKPGAGATIATEYVKNAEPDGYTLLVGANGSMAITPALSPKLGYSPTRDFAAVAQLSSFPLVVLVNKSSSFRSIADLVAYGKANPSKVHYAGSSQAFQVVTELFKAKTGMPMQYIPYKSSAESVTAVISDQVTTTIVDTGPATAQLQGGQVRALAITSEKRAPELPDVPTLAEAGVPDVVVSFWNGLYAPAGTPPAIVKKLEAETLRILAMPDIREKMLKIGVTPAPTPGAEFMRFMETEIARYADVAKKANLVLTP